MNISEMIIERDFAFFEFVKNNNIKPFLCYAKKYEIELPSSLDVMAAGIYKAVQEVNSMPRDIKEIAKEKCIKLGFNPYINKKRPDQ
jgi:hypothetical protein